MNNLNTQQSDVNAWLTGKFLQFFEQIDQESLDSTQIDQMIPLIKQTPMLSDKAKDLNIQFLDTIRKVNKQIKAQHWMSQHLKVLHELGTTFSMTFNMEEIYQKAFELVSRVMDIDAFIIALYEEGDEEFCVPYAIDKGVRYEKSSFPLGSGVISKVLLTRETYHLNTDQDFDRLNSFRWGNTVDNTQSCIFVPMLINNNIKGVISAQNYRSFAYREEHEELLRIIGTQVANAIETAKLYDKVYELSIKDDLTSLKNSRAFHQDLEEYISQFNNGNLTNLTIMMLDSDNLKSVNDRFGHHQGDQLLETIGKALLAVKGPGEEAYRYAGDEFMLICPNLTSKEVEDKAYHIQEFLKGHPLDVDGQKVAVEVSIGIAGYTNQVNNSTEFKKLVDNALYHAKENGKNQVIVIGS